MKSLLRELALAGGLCAGLLAQASVAQASVAQAEAPALVDAACPDIAFMDVRLSCYDLKVPEDRARADSQMLALPVYVLELRFPEAATGTHIPETRRSGLTLLYLHGGPGSRLFFDVADTLKSWVDGLKALEGANLRRLVLFGQRGTEGERVELMRCPRVRELEITAHDEGEVRHQYRAALTQCRDRLIAAGVSLAGYRTAESVKDLVALAKALNVRQWDILAASYGARVATLYAHEQPGTVRSLTLDSPDPWDGLQQFEFAEHIKSSLNVVEIICRRHTRCPGGRETSENFRDLVERSRSEPLSVPLASQDGGDTLQEFGPARLVGTIFDALHRPADALRIPAALAAAKQGDNRLFAALVAATRAPGVAPVFATNALINCGDLPIDQIAATIREQMRKASLFREFLESRLMSITETCAVFDGKRPAEAPGGGRPIDVPVLILSGKLDPVTPYAAADQIAEQFYRARVKQYETLSHGVLADSMCAWSDVSRFLMDPSSRGRGPRGSFLVCRDPVPTPEDLLNGN